MKTSDYPRRRWFRYSLRTLFVVLTVFCVWLGVQVKWIRDRREAREWIEAQGGALLEEEGRAVTIEDVGYGSSRTIGMSKVSDPARMAPLSIRLFGAKSVLYIYLPQSAGASNDKRSELKGLFPESEIRETTSGEKIHH